MKGEGKESAFRPGEAISARPRLRRRGSRTGCEPRMRACALRAGGAMPVGGFDHSGLNGGPDV